MAANLSRFIRNILCIGLFSSGLSTVCATKLTSDDFYEREQVQEIRLTISGLNLKKMKILNLSITVSLPYEYTL